MILPSPLLAGGILFIICITGQERHTSMCDINTDKVYFENKELESLRQSFVIGGECSPATWKSEFSSVVEHYLRNQRGLGLSDHDRALLVYIAEDQQSRESQLSFSSEGQGTPHLVSFEIGKNTRSRQTDSSVVEIEGNDGLSENSVSGSLRKRQIPGPSFFGFGSPRSSQFPGFSDFFAPNFQRKPQSQMNLFSPNLKNVPQNKKCQNNLENNVRSNSQNTPDISRVSIQRKPKNQVHLEKLIRPDNQRPQIEGRTDNFILPDSQRESQNEALHNVPLFPFNQRITQNKGRFSPSASQKSPQNQRQSGISRPNNPTRLQPSGRSDDLIMPESTNSNQRQLSDNVPNSLPPVLPRTTTTSTRPESTTLPGPPTWATAPSLCSRRCPSTPEYNPVCGTDNVTYRNPGRLRCEQSCGKEDLDMSHYGSCRFLTGGTPLRKIIG